MTRSDELRRPPLTVTGLGGPLSAPQSLDTSGGGHSDPPGLPSGATPPTPLEEVQRHPVRVRQLLEACTARFAILRATLVDLSGAGTGGSHLDLLLDFGNPGFSDPSFSLYGLGDAEPLGLRFVFADAEEAETFTAADGTLLGIAVSPAEGRLFFKLRLPEHWRASPRPLHALWLRLECCVIFYDD